MKKVILFSSIFFACSACDVIHIWQDEYPDNFIEEFVEDAASDAIENYTGFEFDFDLTPSTPEKKK